MLPYLRLGPFLLHTTGLVLLLGVWVGLSVSEKEARRLDLEPDMVYNLVFFGLVSGLIAARLAYAARYPDAYLANPASLFALNANTLAPANGLLIGILAALLYGWRNEMMLRPTLDALTPGLAAFMVAWGISHLLSGEAFGSPANLPWSIYLWNEYRHPAQIYEILAAFGVLLVVWRRPFRRPGQGLNFLLVIALSAAARVFLEAFRGDSLIWPGGFRAAQVVSLLILLAALGWMRAWSRPNPPHEDELKTESGG